MRKKYNTPHRRHVVKTRMTDEEYADFTGRLAAYEISQSEFIRQAIRKATIRPIVTVSPVNDGLLAALSKLTAEYGKIGGNLNQIARSLNEYGSPYRGLEKEVRGAAAEVDLLRNTLANVFIILFFVILIIATLASMIYSRYVTRPVLRLSAVSKNMSELNFSWKCEESRTDELGVLAHSLNEMSKKLSAALENLQAANIKLQADIEHEKELEQAQLDFFSAVSHELKTPITIIKGQTEGMILNVGDYQDRNKYLSRSLEIINTMESMVQEILTVSRMKSSKVGLRKEKMDFSDLLKREYALFEDLIVQKEIDWNENISPALQIVVDKMLIQKAINNIVSNAILYSPRGSSIYMDAFSKNGSVVFQIENTGVHIPEAEIPKLFDAFYRMEQSRNRKTGGSGLGLYIVKTILEQHNIIYSLKNTDRGVLFSIRF